MKYQEFSAIYNALKSISSDESLNQGNVIEAIKIQLSQDSDAYKEWEKGNFSLDHVFTTVPDHKHTLLTVAFNNPDLEVAKFLIKLGADVNAVGVDGLTPLIIAIEKKCGDPKHKELVDLLIEKADVNAAGADGMTPISKAVERGDLETFEALMEKKAKVDVKPPHGESLLEWAEFHQPDPRIKKKDMEEIINTLKALSEEKKQTDPEIAASTSTNNSKQEDEVRNTTPTVPDETSGEISPEERDADYALECQIEEIALSTDGQLPENNDINFTDAHGVTTTPTNSSNTPTAPTADSKTPGNNGASLPGNKKKDTVNAATTSINSSETSPAPTTGNTTPENNDNDTTFWSEHKGKIALGVTGLCVVGAIAAYVLAYPVVALVLAVSALAALAGAYIGGVFENPSVEALVTPQKEAT